MVCQTEEEGLGTSVYICMCLWVCTYIGAILCVCVFVCMYMKNIFGRHNWKLGGASNKKLQ